MSDGVIVMAVVLFSLFIVALAMPRPAARPLTDEERRESEAFEHWLRTRPR